MTGVFIVPEQRRVTCSVLFYFRLVPEAFKFEPMHRKGKPYHLFSHIFRPEFVKYNQITYAVGDCLKNSDNDLYQQNQIRYLKFRKVNRKEKISSRGFKIANLNIRSLMKNIDQLRLYLGKQQYDKICINETMLDNTVAEYEVHINGYDIIRKDRNRNSGGVAIYIRNVINYRERYDLNENNLEAIALEISKPKSKPFLVSAWYRPPDSPIEIFTYFEEFLRKMDAEDKEIIVIGDFNCNWDQDITGLSPQTEKLRDVVTKYQFEQLIKGHTRIKNHSATLIDFAFTNKPENIVKTSIEHTRISDHSLIYIKAKSVKSQKLLFQGNIKIIIQKRLNTI